MGQMLCVTCFDMLFVMVRLGANLLKCVFIVILFEPKKVQITHFPKREKYMNCLKTDVLLLNCTGKMWLQSNTGLYPFAM